MAELLFIALLIVGAVFGALLSLRAKSTWREFHAGDGRSHAAPALYQALRRGGVRCRYRVGTSGALLCSDGPMSRIQAVTVLVHRDDLHRARQVQSALRARVG